MVEEPKLLPISECKVGTECLKPPIKGDGICEVSKGEADPISVNFDKESCGYCGDGIRQQNAAAWGKPVQDTQDLFFTQNVTGRETETPDNCPVDFHCGNGKMEREWSNSYYSAYVQLDNGSFGIKPVKVVESCNQEKPNYCPSDCKKKGGKGPAVEDEEDPLPEGNRYFTCPHIKSGSEPMDLINRTNSGVRAVLGRLSSAVATNTENLRILLTGDAHDQSPVSLSFSIKVDGTGKVSLDKITASCNSAVCDKNDELISQPEVNLNGVTLGAPGSDCYWTIPFNLPTLQARPEQPAPPATAVPSAQPAASAVPSVSPAPTASALPSDTY